MHYIEVQDFCSTGDQISQLNAPIQPVVTPYDATKFEVETVTLKDWFQDATTYSDAWFLEFCLYSVITCSLVDSLGAAFSHAHIRLGDRGEKWAIFASQVAEGYQTPEMFLTCYNGQQTITSTSPFTVEIECTTCTSL
jgi:hypothetical protein